MQADGNLQQRVNNCLCHHPVAVTEAGQFLHKEMRKAVKHGVNHVEGNVTSHFALRSQRLHEWSSETRF